MADPLHRYSQLEIKWDLIWTGSKSKFYGATMHPEDPDVTFDMEIVMQFLENDALVYFAIDDLVWFKIIRSWEYRC